jgi:WD40 repeat protein
MTLVAPAHPENTKRARIVLSPGISFPAADDGPFLFTPDNKSIVRASRKAIETWNIETGDRTALWPRAADLGCGTVDAIALSDDGRLLVEGGSEGLIRVWNAREGKLVHAIRAHVVRERKVHTIERDGKVIENVDEVRDVPSRITSVDFSGDGKLVAAVAGGDTVSISDVRSGEVVRRLSLDSAITSAHFLADGKTMVTVHAWRDGGQKPISIWDVESGKRLKQLSSGEDATGIGVVSVSNRGEILAGTMGRSEIFADPTIRLWNLAERRRLPPISPPDEDGYGVDLAVSPDGKYVAVVGFSNRLVLWSVADQARLAELEIGAKETPTELTAVRFSPDGAKLAVRANEYRAVGDGSYEGVRARMIIVDVVSAKN